MLLISRCPADAPGQGHRINVSTRLTDLAPFNLNTGNSTRADDIRTKLTTVSSDRKQFSCHEASIDPGNIQPVAGDMVFPTQFGAVALIQRQIPCAASAEVAGNHRK